MKKLISARVEHSLLITIAALFIYTLAVEDILGAIAVGIAAFVASFLVQIYLPIAKRKRFAAQVEKDLPFALMAIAVEMNMNLPLEQCLRSVAKENYGKVSGEFSKIVMEITESGASVEEALLSFSERIDSRLVRRCVSQIVGAYRQGSKNNAGEPIKRLARELLARQRAASKEFAGKMVLFSLMFIAVSAIVPALFQSFIVVGSMFMSLGFSASDVLIIAIFVFPLLDLGVLFYIRSKTPLFLR